MMHLWLQSYSNVPASGSSALLSVAVHAALVGAAVVATRPPAGLESGWLENRPYYLPPPNRVAGSVASRERLQYIDLALIGSGSGFGVVIPSQMAENIVDEAVQKSLGDLGTDLTATIAAPDVDSRDSVFTQIEVDSSVVRYPDSAAPDYPITMLKQGIQGSVRTQYVVDTAGHADVASLIILNSTHPDFSAAVRDVLPRMRFAPARIGVHAVRQMVEQEFSFRIDPAVATQSGAKRGERKKPDGGT